MFYKCCHQKKKTLSRMYLIKKIRILWERLALSFEDNLCLGLAALSREESEMLFMLNYSFRIKLLLQLFCGITSLFAFYIISTGYKFKLLLLIMPLFASEHLYSKQTFNYCND